MTRLRSTLGRFALFPASSKAAGVRYAELGPQPLPDVPGSVRTRYNESYGCIADTEHGKRDDRHDDRHFGGQCRQCIHRIHYNEADASLSLYHPAPTEFLHYRQGKFGAVIGILQCVMNRIGNQGPRWLLTKSLAQDPKVAQPVVVCLLRE